MGVDKLNQSIDTNELMSLDDMANGHLDVATLGEAANEDKVITSRLGKQYPSAPMASRLLVENGLLGARPFSTYAKMTAPDVDPPLVDEDYAIVTNDTDLRKNGVYQKLNGVFVYSKYNIQSQISVIETQLTSVNNSPLRNLYNDLNNPLMSVKIKLVGDSITWGIGASGNTEGQPRTGKLTDPRNTTVAATSPTWANLLREYLAKTYTDGDLVHVGGGVAYAQSNSKALFSKDTEFFEFKTVRTGEILSSELIRSKVKTGDIEGGESLLIINPQYPTDTFPTEFSFDVNGAGFDIVYTKLNNGTADTYFVNVYVDGIFNKKISMFSASGSYNNVETVVLPNNGKHRVTIKNESTGGSYAAQIQHIKVAKRVTVANDGISGSTTNSWLANVTLAQSIQTSDDYVFVMLGTNDRIKASYHGEAVFAKNMRTIVDNIKTLTANKARVVLMSASAVTQGEDPVTSNYFMTMRVVNNTIKNIADEKTASFISNYAATQQYKIDSDAFLSDGLHPNDFGHRAIFDNIKNAIVNS